MPRLIPAATITRTPLNVYVKRQRAIDTGTFTTTIYAPYPPSDFGIIYDWSFSAQLRRRDWLLVGFQIRTDRGQWAGRRMRAKVFAEAGWQGDHALSYSYATQRLVADENLDLRLQWQLVIVAPPATSTMPISLGFTEVGLTGGPPFPLTIAIQVLRLEPTEYSTTP